MIRIIRPAYTVETGNRIVLDGDEVIVTDVRQDLTRKTVTLTTSYGAPRTVTWKAAVPVLFGLPASH